MNTLQSEIARLRDQLTPGYVHVHAPAQPVRKLTPEEQERVRAIRRASSQKVRGARARVVGAIR